MEVSMESLAEAAKLLEAEERGASLGASSTPSTQEQSEMAKVQEELKRLQQSLQLEQQKAVAAEGQARLAEQRRSHTESEWHKMNRRVEQAEAAAAQAAQYVQQQRQAPPPQAPPPIEDIDLLMSDPRKLQAAMEARDMYVYQTTRDQLRQEFANELANLRGELYQQTQQLQGSINNVWNPVAQWGGNLAEQQAGKMLSERYNVTPEQFQEALPAIRQAVAQFGGQTNPEAIATSYLYFGLHGPQRQNGAQQASAYEKQEPPVSLRGDATSGQNNNGAGGRKLNRDHMVALGVVANALGEPHALAAKKAWMEGR